MLPLRSVNVAIDAKMMQIDCGELVDSGGKDEFTIPCWANTGAGFGCFVENS
jgi:hypothetical protein